MSIVLIKGHTLEDVKNSVIGEIKPYVQDFLQKNVIVVPDRYSLIVEKSVFDVLNISSTFNIFVMGINQLAKKMIDSAGLDCVYIDQTQSDFVLYRAIQNQKDNFICFSKTLNTGLVEKIKNSLALLRSSNVEAKDLDSLNTDDVNLQNKIHDLRLVLEEYEKLIDFRLDATNVLKTFSNLIENTHMYDDYNFYFCGFESFTSQGYDIVKKICKVAKNVTIGVITPTKFSNKNIYDDEMQKVLTAFLDENKIEYTLKSVEPKFDGDNDAIYKNLFGHSIKKQNLKTTVISFPKKEDEIENIAMQIAYNAKNGLKYNEMCVATSSTYFPLIENIFSEYKISYYIDDKMSLSNSPIYNFIKCIFELLTDKFEKENIVNLIESYFFDIDRQKKYEIINYVRENNIKYKKITKIYDFDEKIKYIFEKLNNLKIKEKFEYYIQFLNEIFEYFNLEDKLAQISQSYKDSGDLQLEKVYVQIYDKINTLNKKICDILGEQEISLKDFFDFYDNALKNINISKVPLSVDSVFVGDICKSFFEPKNIMYVIGATSDMPTKIKDESLILDGDIEKLNSMVNISPTVKVINKRNKFRLFDSLLMAKEHVITYPLFDEDGKKIVNSTFVDDLVALGANTTTNEEYKLSEDIESLKLHAPNKVVARKYIENSKAGADIKQALKTLGEDVEYTPKQFFVSSAKTMLKNNKIKITQLESYYTCPFKHFISYGLKLVENKDGEMRQNDFGNFLHDFCNNLIRSAKKNIGEYDESELEALILNCFDNLIKSEKYFLLNDEENELSKQILKSEAIRFGKFLSYEQKKSDFKIYKTEYKFDSDLSVTIDDKDFSLVGIVDRVDKFEDYYSVIDYKTGSLASNNAQIANLYYGTKIQVYVYLKALTKKFNGKAFGAFYLPITNAFLDDDSDAYKLNGYFLDDVNLCEHADLDLKDNYKSKLFEASFSTSKENMKKGIKKLLSKKKVKEEDFEAMLDYSLEIVKQGVKEIINGSISPSPIKDGCNFCAYKDICGHDQSVYRKKTLKVTPSTFTEATNE